jgi:hypothetical protein
MLYYAPVAIIVQIFVLAGVSIRNTMVIQTGLKTAIKGD